MLLVCPDLFRVSVLFVHYTDALKRPELGLQLAKLLLSGNHELIFSLE
mgnify:CR=1 FL=1